jgi:hypothetical protein
MALSNGTQATQNAIFGNKFLNGGEAMEKKSFFISKS